MNINPQFIIICREAFLQAGNNSLNLIGVFGHLNADKLPFVYSRFSVVVNFDIDVAGDHVLRTDIIDPSGQQVANSELPVRTNEGNWQVIANFEHMQFSSYGVYLFVLSLDGVSVGTRSLELKPMYAPAAGRKPSIA